MTTFDSLESSVESSQPIEVFHITLGGEQFYYTSSEDVITLSGIDYDPIAIRRGALRETSEGRNSNLEIILPGDNEFARRFINNAPSLRAFVTVSRVQRLDFPGPEVRVLFEGFVRTVEFDFEALEAKLLVSPNAGGQTRPIPSFTYMAQCNHVLYDARCGIDKESPSFKHTGAVLTVVGNVITVSGAGSFASGFFTGGYATDLGTGDVRLVLNHTSTSLQLLLPFPQNMVGRTCVVRAGCDRTIATCKSKFNNVTRFGGFAFVPTRNIFETGVD